jgi:hypothetical protein
MLKGEVDWLFKAWHGCAPLDPRPFLTASREDLEHYFIEHPDLAQAYYDQQQRIESDNEIDRIETDADSYTVSYLDHGSRRFERRFGTLAGAVTEHLLRVYGLAGR